jgi:hypothetical protein
LQGVKLSSWLEGKLKQALTKNMVFPACTDIKLPFLLDEADLETVAIPLYLPAVPMEPTSSSGSLSPTWPHVHSNSASSSLASSDIPIAADVNNGAPGGDRANKAALVCTCDEQTTCFSSCMSRNGMSCQQSELMHKMAVAHPEMSSDSYSHLGIFV